jgi:hypothetical protein
MDNGRIFELAVHVATKQLATIAYETQMDPNDRQESYTATIQRHYQLLKRAAEATV